MAEKDDSITEDEPTLRSKVPQFVPPPNRYQDAAVFIQAKYWTPGPRRSTTLITIHTAECHEGKGAARAVANFFRDPHDAKGPIPPQRGGSSHYVTDDVEVVQCVREEDLAWHAGPVNGDSIGIELAGAAGQSQVQWGDEYSTRTLANAAALVADLCQRYAIPIRKLSPDQVWAREAGICGHIDVTKGLRTGTHWDPGPNFPWQLFLGMVRAAAGLE